MLPGTTVRVIVEKGTDRRPQFPPSSLVNQENEDRSPVA